MFEDAWFDGPMDLRELLPGHIERLGAAIPREPSRQFSASGVSAEQVSELEVAGANDRQVEHALGRIELEILRARELLSRTARS